MYYPLDASRDPVPEPDPETWRRWRAEADLRVALEKIGESEVSTVFLGEAHGGGPDGPVLWETMILGGRFDDATVRCAGTREDAHAMHAKVVEQLQRLLAAEWGGAGTPGRKDGMFLGFSVQ